MNGNQSPSTIKTELDLVFEAEYGLESVPGYATVDTAGVFMQDSTDRAAIIVEQFMGTGYFETRDELADVPTATAKVGNQKTFSVLNYSKSVDISKNFFDDDQWSTVNRLVKNMARNARLTKSKLAFGKYAGGFATVTTNDSVYLFSDSHVTLNGDTVDNLMTETLTEASLNTAFNKLIEQKTQDGTLGGHVPAILLVPTALFKTAMTITKSVLKSGTGNNDMNYYSELYPGLQVFHSPFLGASYGGSDTAWYLLSSDHSMYRWVRQAVVTDLVDYKFQRNNNYIYKAEYREVVGPISYEGLVGSTGLVAG
jgi:phage major head subunit gpT-like protein